MRFPVFSGGDVLPEEAVVGNFLPPCLETLVQKAVTTPLAFTGVFRRGPFSGPVSLICFPAGTFIFPLAGLLEFCHGTVSP